METKKIAIACFVGAAIGTVIALSVAPMFWWLGMLAGFGAGYLCYDLKEIREKAPIAFEKTKEGSAYSLVWLKRPHPFFWPSLLIFVLSALFGLNLVLKSKDATLLLLFPSIAGIYLVFVFYSILSFLAVIGSTKHKFGKNCYWGKDMFGEKQGRGNVCIKPTYRNIYGLILCGLWICIYFVFWEMWILTPRFLKNLFIFIYSQKRVLCGFGSAIGVAVTYFTLGARAVTPGQQIMVVICGGIIGAVVGILSYEIISKRLLHLAPAENHV